jgi:hypothetical protein
MRVCRNDTWMGGQLPWLGGEHMTSSDAWLGVGVAATLILTMGLLPRQMTLWRARFFHIHRAASGWTARLGYFDGSDSQQGSLFF